MKNFIYTLLLLPLMALSQTGAEYPVIENGMITANPGKIAEFEAGMAAHNKKYHAEGAYGARVYWIANGTNVGKYMWIMGPLPWSAFDARPAQEGHDADWNTNVLAHALAEGDQTYWKFHPNLSNFSTDITLKNLRLTMVDIAPFKDQQFFGLLEKISAVMKSSAPDGVFGMYTNEFPNSNDGRDFAFVDFFDKMAWLGRDDTFPKDYEAVHGAGSFAIFIKDLGEVTKGVQHELWHFREDLSGLSGKIEAVTRQ